MEEIDVAIFTFDNETKLRLVNRAGERLLARPLERLLGFTAGELGLRSVPGRRGGSDDGAELSGRVGALGNAARIVSTGRFAASPGGAERSEPGATG